MTNSDVLDEAYERLQRMGPEFDGDEEGNNGLTNHGPMTAEVLSRRGYQDIVGTWVDNYVPRLIEMPSVRTRIGPGNWQESIGNGKEIGSWTAYFTSQVNERPWGEVLVEWWPRLLPGIAAGATHGVIRVGHAVRTLTGGDTSVPALTELAHGLAFWAARSRLLPGATAPAGSLQPAQALAAVPRLAEQRGLIVDRLTRLGDVAGWPDAQAALTAPADDDGVVTLLQNLVSAATLRYLTHGHGSPVLLVHTATAPNAVLHTLPSLPRELWAPSLHAVWSAAAALIATYESQDAIPRDELPSAPSAGDPVSEVLQRAAGHGDEHVIKFTDTAAEVYDRTGNPDALASAVRITELIASPG